jgi:hypothetical protein
MRRSSPVARIIRSLLKAYTAFLIYLAAALPAASHEVIPAIADFRSEQGQIALDIRLNLEAMVAGLNLDGLADTNASVLSDDYDALRSLQPAELQPLASAVAGQWVSRLKVTAGGPVAMEITEIRIPEAGDTSLPRQSMLLLNGTLPEEARHLSLQWPEGSGSVVLRQHGVDDPYAGYLQGGGTSPQIPLAGGGAMTPMEAFLSYIPVGFTHILPKGWDHILFVLGLFFLSPKLRPLLWQVSAFTVAHTATLALGTLGIVTVSPAIVEPLIAASIVYVGIENIFARHLHSGRTLIVFCFGLLHGLGFASVLGEFGLAEGQFLSSLLGFNVGVELGQLAVIAAAFLTLGLRFRGSLKYRGRVAIPASVTIAAVGGFWFVERVFL